MKKHKGKIQMGIVIGIFSVIIIVCLISIFSRMYTENKEKEEFRQLAEIVTEETTIEKQSTLLDVISYSTTASFNPNAATASSPGFTPDSSGKI